MFIGFIIPNQLKSSNAFNIQHLASYLKEKQNSRTSSLQPWENDIARLEITGDF